ncbi:NADP-dependent oxidoreductase domain-containing protein [Gymnopilus junonius]|uniref:NADP-dependent oxidoreductase domain-containing protein n=1 Tax=Gymnopilus junonius TaxID=109634 RepID=A0A9P5NXF7_GYMJU|nr:NADP-dependent oxidoreductase domain-containing protein [Gymnopilus junonius]
MSKIRFTLNTDAANLVRVAIENGITHLDGAQMYNNEDTLAQNPCSGETVKESLKASLARLGLDYIDLFLIHDPTPATKEGKLAEWWKGLEEVHEEGLAKNIGVSNFKIEDLKIVLETGKIVPAANQAAEPLVKFCQEKGIAIESYGGQTPLKSRGKPVTTGQVLTKWLLQKNVIVVTTTSKVERIKEFQDAEDVPT